MQEHVIRQRSRERVAALTDLIPNPWSIEAFVDRLSKQRGRAITLQSFQAEGGDAPCGFYMSTATEDRVLYPEQANRLQRDHVILHELGHLLHDSDPTGNADAVTIDPAYAKMLFPDIPLDMIRNFLARTTYDTDIEQQAEGFADEFRHVIDKRRQRMSIAKMTKEQRVIAERLGSILEHPFQE